MNMKHIGMTLDEFLESEGIEIDLAKVQARATKYKIVKAIKKRMETMELSIDELAALAGTSRSATSRFLNPNNTSMTLNPLTKYATAVKLSVKIRLK